MSSRWKVGKRTVAGAAGTGAGIVVYSLCEPHLYRLVTHDLQVGPGVPRLDILHVSDTHLGARDKSRARWLSRLPARLGRTPDLVVATGDLIQDDTGIDPVVELLAGLEGRLGRYYVLGSHDYYQSTFQSYAKYWTGERQLSPRRANVERLEGGLRAKGWVPLTNRSEVAETSGGPVRLVGVDDPYLSRHRTEHISRQEDDACAIGVMHSPEIVSHFALAGFDLILAGHTHAGQVRVPWAGAVITNSSLPAGLAGGPHRVGSSWLHVSPGLGQGRFSPIRFNCRPEATLLRLRPVGKPKP